MSKTVRLEDSTWSELEKRGVALAAGRGSAIGITPDAIIRYILEIDDSSTSNPTAPDPSLAVATPTRPHSSVQSVQQLLDGILNGLEAILGPVTLVPTQSGRWISQPSNFFTVKPQDARNRDVAVTVYGEPQDFSNVAGSLIIRKDRSSYSRFNVATNQEVSDAIKVICASADLKDKR